MVLGGILERIMKKSPVPVMARAAMEFALRLGFRHFRPTAVGVDEAIAVIAVAPKAAA